MTTLTISLGQMDVKAGSPEVNMLRVKEWIAEAARRNSDIVIFPELWDTGYALDRALELGTSRDEGRFAEVAELAQAKSIHVIGSMMELREEKAFNTAIWFGQDGKSAGAYSKLHLFRLMDEDKYLTPGQSSSLINHLWGKSGVSICYDLRFPELFREYALAGASITFLPAEWPHPRMMHWRTLIRARAIENQMFMVACNRVGKDPDGTHFFGHSMIIDPWGETIIEAGEGEGLYTATIDLSIVDTIRAKIPVFEDRRPETYDLS